VIQADSVQESIELTAQVLGMDRRELAFIAAIEADELAGDIDVVGEDGKALSIDEQRAILGLPVDYPG